MAKLFYSSLADTRNLTHIGYSDTLRTIAKMGIRKQIKGGKTYFALYKGNKFLKHIGDAEEEWQKERFLLKLPIR